MMVIFWYIDLLFFMLFALWVGYVLVFAAASRLKGGKPLPEVIHKTRFAILFPAYKEDNVIKESVQCFIAQDYPAHLYQVVVISDSMEEATDQELRRMGAWVIHPVGDKRSKAVALQTAVAKLNKQLFDAVVIMDADNIVFSDFLTKLNQAFVYGARAVQTHRTAKNKATVTAVLDGVSEEINNAIFRLGHARLGFPAALIGSGMAFEWEWFENRIAQIESMGEDKFLEYYLLIDRVDTLYLEEVIVLDEKIQSSGDFSKQRRRWIASQIDIFKLASKQFFQAIRSGNWPLVDKIVQWSMPPRIIMLGMLPLFYVGSLLIGPISSVKWFFLVILYLIGLALAVPAKLYTKQLLLAVFSLPRMFIAMLSSIMHFRSGRSTFIHTKHGEISEKEKIK